MSNLKRFAVVFCGGVFIVAFFLVGNADLQAQTKPKMKAKNLVKTAPKSDLPIITEATPIDLEGLKMLLLKAMNAKPVLLNFWATWCTPCREEFPDLVKINAEFHSKGLNFSLVSLDDVEDIKTEVPKFLREMRSTMPVYLLKTEDEGEAIKSVAPEWSGGLPFTALFDANGKLVYSKMGKVNPEILRAEINKLLVSDKSK